MNLNVFLLKILVFFSFSDSNINEYSNFIESSKNKILSNFKKNDVFFINKHFDPLLDSKKQIYSDRFDDLLNIDLNKLISSQNEHNSSKESLIFITIGHGKKDGDQFFMHYGDELVNINRYKKLFTHLKKKFNIYTILNHCHSGAFFHIIKDLNICGVFSTLSDKSSYGCIKNKSNYDEVYLLDLILIKLNQVNLELLSNFLLTFNMQFDLPHLSSDILINEYMKKNIDIFLNSHNNIYFNEEEYYYISFFYDFWEMELGLNKIKGTDDFDIQFENYYNYLSNSMNKIDDQEYLYKKLNLLYRLMIYINRIKVNYLNLTKEDQEILEQMKTCEKVFLLEDSLLNQ